MAVISNGEVGASVRAKLNTALGEAAAACSWGDHALAGYVVSANLNISNWDEAHGWGDHGSVGYLTSEADTLDSVTDRGAATANSVSLGGITGNAVTQSATDTTAGRLTKVGDFGLGNDTASIQAPGSDLNDLRTTGLWRASSGINANMPFTGAGQLWHSQQAGDSATQLLLGITDPRMYFRDLSGGTWSSWKVVYAQNSILGSVSQSAGVPTGAVIDRGSNANGEYVKYADGTLICWSDVITNASTSVTIAQAGGFRGTIGEWTYPASFSSTPAIFVMSRNANNLVSVPVSLDASSVRYSAWRVDSGTFSCSYQAMAIGRWF